MMIKKLYKNLSMIFKIKYLKESKMFLKNYFQ